MNTRNHIQLVMVVKLAHMMIGVNVQERFVVELVNNIAKDIIKMPTVQPNATENCSKQRVAPCRHVETMVK